MKNLVALLTVACLSVYLVGCGEDSTKPAANGSGNGSSTPKPELGSGSRTPDAGDATKQSDASKGAKDSMKSGEVSKADETKTTSESDKSADSGKPDAPKQPKKNSLLQGRQSMVRSSIVARRSQSR